MQAHKSALTARPWPQGTTRYLHCLGFQGLLLTKIGVLTMSKMTAEEKEEYRKAITDNIIKSASKEYDGTASLKHWRAWGSWFSWGSPVGLGLFFIETAAAIWVLTQAF